MLEDFRLKIFLTVAQTGNFTRSSKLLNISQPAVSQNITELEKILNTQLFYREKNGIRLTDEGIVLKKYAEKIQSWYESVENIFYKKDNFQPTLGLKISASEEISSYFLADLVLNLRISYPNIDIQIGFFEDADINLSLSSSPRSAVLEDESKLSFSACLIASSFNKLSFKHISGPSDLKESMFAVWSEYLPLLDPDVLSRVSLKTDSLELLKRVVETSPELIGIVPEFSIKNETKYRSLIRIFQMSDLKSYLVVTANDEFTKTRLYSLVIQSLNQLSEN